MSKRSLFKQFKKLTREELAELVKRIEQINSYVLIIQGLEMQKALWINNKVKEKGLNPNEKYHIDFKTGHLIPIAQVVSDNPPQKPEEVPQTEIKK